VEEADAYLRGTMKVWSCASNCGYLRRGAFGDATSLAQRQRRGTGMSRQGDRIGGIVCRSLAVCSFVPAGDSPKKRLMP
jgi:hypothetical protein